MNRLSKYSQKSYQSVIWIVLSLFCLLPTKFVFAQNSECAEVKIVIEQKLSFERQAFDARMLINNGLTDTSLKNIRIDLLFTDKNNQPVVVTQNANEDEAKFFYQVNSLSSINSIDGNGEVNANANAEIHWLIIPAYGSAEFDDTLYYIGAKVTYTLNGQETTVEVTPDYVVVKPQPLLTLDYFMPKDVYGDDPFTSEVEPSMPFTLGVRVKNDGRGISYKTTIDSAQPKIVENKQNLLIDFTILGGYVGDQAAGKSLLLDFGDIEGNTAKIGRWNMITSLSGQFVAFDATFTHADTLGGSVTSLLKAVNTHTLIHDVKVDLPDRDNITDFLALDGDVIRVYESEGQDTEINDQSLNATLTTVGKETKLIFPETRGLVYVKIADPSKGNQELNNIKRSDGKILPVENVWLSKIRNDDLSWSYFINLFDSNSTGNYVLNTALMNQIIGTNASETLYGTPEDDYIDGKGGNDTIYGLAGNDTLLGGEGNDTIYGGDGDDYLDGGNGSDRLIGDNGNDTLVAGPQGGWLQGGKGNDVYILEKGFINAVIDNTGAGTDVDRVIYKGLYFADAKVTWSVYKYYMFIRFSNGDVLRVDNNGSINQLRWHQFEDKTISISELFKMAEE